ncbi:MAG: FHA domain-containing protein, partial [Deltaproteobacteria bacterium]|nr:FHA domain-containing protein [Kofleriaceae bacterium]
MSETLSAIVAPTSQRRGVPALYVGLSGDAPRSPPARLGLGGLDRVVIGRGPARRFTRARAAGGEQLDVVLPDARLSTTHVRLSRLGGGWFAEDLDSKNGTWVRGARITRQPLADGDVLVAGHSAFVFRATGGSSAISSRN